MHPLQKLLADNRGRGLFRAESSGQEATLYLYDAIVSDALWGGVCAADFVRELVGLQAQTIHLRINSPGGEVFAAQAMAQAIREHPANIVAHVDGYAASAASLVALAADEVVISEGGFFMIHKAMTIAVGNANDMLETAALLEKVDATLVETYARETGQDPQQIADWMAAETWFNAEEAVQYGFADKCATPDKKKAKNLTQWDLSAWAHAPKVEAPEADPDPAPVLVPVFDTEHLRRRLMVVERQAA